MFVGFSSITREWGLNPKPQTLDLFDPKAVDVPKLTGEVLHRAKARVVGGSRQDASPANSAPMGFAVECFP